MSFLGHLDATPATRLTPGCLQSSIQRRDPLSGCAVQVVLWCMMMIGQLTIFQVDQQNNAAKQAPGNVVRQFWPVLDDELLAQMLRKPLTDQACAPTPS